jgi:hypothetical protein
MSTCDTLSLDAMHGQRAALDELDTLDHLHAIAIEQGIVTPYPSMIVLVNQQQENLLDQLEARGDRFQREYEEVGETTPQSPVNADLVRLHDAPRATSRTHPLSWIM